MKSATAKRLGLDRRHMRDTIRLFRREGIPGSDFPEFPSPGTVHRAYAGGQGWRTGLLITALHLFRVFFHQILSYLYKSKTVVPGHYPDTTVFL